MRKMTETRGIERRIFFIVSQNYDSVKMRSFRVLHEKFEITYTETNILERSTGTNSL